MGGGTATCYQRNATVGYVKVRSGTNGEALLSGYFGSSARFPMCKESAGKDFLK